MKIKNITNDGKGKYFTMENGDWVPFFQWSSFEGSQVAGARFHLFENDNDVATETYIAFLEKDFAWDENGSSYFVEVRIETESRRHVVNKSLPVSKTQNYKPTKEYFLKKILQAFYDSESQKK